MDTKALRQKILDLAIRGKLVPQDPNDEPASVLLERIRAEKQQMVKDGKLKAKDIKNDTVIFKGDDNLHYEKFPDGSVKCIEDEIPFELPRGWEWCRFNCVLDVRDGTHDTPSYIPNGIPLITSKNLSEGGIDYSNVKYISHEDALLINERSGVDKGDILFAMIGTIGNPAMVSDDKLISIKNVALFKFTYSLNINHKYIMAYLDYTQDDMKKRPSGGLQPFVSLNFLRQYFVPIPPISEQHRIVDKLNELLSFVDTIETDKTSLQDLIKQTKSKILDLAIRGKLVPQDPNDEPASVLLERIRAEKEELIKQGKIKRDKKESVIFKGDDNSYYQDLPNGWSVCKLCEISYFERGITFPASAKEAAPTGRNIACARTANVQDSFDISNLIYVDKSFMKDNPDKFLKVNDIIVSTANSLELVGKSCIVEKLLEKMTFGGFVTVIRGIGINHKYIHMCLKNKFLKGEFSYKSTQTTNIANISTKDLAETLIYLPPLAEQRRIVNTIEALFAQIDKIVEQIS